VKARPAVDWGARALLLACVVGLVGAQQPKPADGENEFNAGLTHLQEGRYQPALESFKKAIKQDSKNAYFYKGLGLAYTQLAGVDQTKDGRAQKYKEAIAAFRKALELNPFFVDARNDLATALVLSGDRDAGRREYLTAYTDATNPTPEQTALNLGQSYYEEKNYAEAINWFRTSVTRNKSYPLAYVSLADALLAADQTAEAIKALEDGSKALPDNISITLALGRAYYKAGRFGEAKEKLQQVASKDPAGPAGRSAAELLKNIK
jgi:tetratricopeptide (TPR) repeat protein